MLAGKVAGVAGLEPVTSAVTGQRSNQLSYTPACGLSCIGFLRPFKSYLGNFRITCPADSPFPQTKVIRAADAKEVGVENPAEETSHSPNRRQD